MSHKSKFTLGIYGDGQLARLLALSALRSQLSIIVYSLNPAESPCRNLATLYEGKSWTDQKSFLDFCAHCDSLVLENEWVPFEFLEMAEKDGLKIFPNASSFKAVSNKLKQVQLARESGINIPEYQLISSSDELSSLKLPVMLKSLSGGYDGYGNFAFKSPHQLEAARTFIQNKGPALAQEFLEFDQEVAVIIASDGQNYFSFPVVETVQEKNICHFVLSPPRFSTSIQDKIKESALKLIRHINGVGVFGVEFFITGEKVVFNEIAPRPHNSGHYSIEACSYSQFDALVSLLQGHQLTNPELKVPAVGMLNLLGTQNGKAHFQGDDRFFHSSEGFLHLYGKEDSRIGRKMGHFTLLGHSSDALLDELKELRNRYQI